MKPAVDFEPFITKGKMSVEGGPEKTIVVLRDTGASLSLVHKGLIEWTDKSFSGVEANVKGLGARLTIPLNYVLLESDL